MPARPLGPPVTLTKESYRNRIAKVGIELEGIWLPGQLPQGTIPMRDGSLDEYANEFALARGIPCEVHGRQPHPGYAAVGEVTSQPLPVEDVEAWIRPHYPQECTHVKCGLHVHMSFSSALTYQRTMDPRYGGTIVEYMRQWTAANLPADHHMWPRLRGENIYCQHIFDAEAQTRNLGRMGDGQRHFDQRREGHRYTVINYCFGAHQTIECRLMTMMPTVDLAISAVKEVIRVTNGFLVATASRETKLRAEVQDEGGVFVEDRRIFV